MTGDLSDVAYLAALTSVAIAAVMLMVLLWLVARRFHAEAHATERLAQEREIARAMLSAISKGDGDSPASFLSDIPEGAQVAATTHLFQLLRGADRDRLIALAEASGVFGGAMAALRHRNMARRVDAIRLLERFGTEASVAGLAERLATDPSPVVRIEAAATLARLDRLPPAQQVIQSLHLGDVALTRQHRALLRMMAPRHSEELRQLLDEPLDTPLRAAIVEALGWSHDFSVLPDIERHAAHREAPIRRSALKAAGQLGHPAARDWVTHALDDDDGDVRAEAIAACDHLGLAAVLPRIAAMRTDPTWNVRVQARRIAGPAARDKSTAGLLP